MIIKVEPTYGANQANVNFVVKLNYTEAVGVSKRYQYYIDQIISEVAKLIPEAK